MKIFSDDNVSCPNCKSVSTQASRWNSSDEKMRNPGLKPLRCIECGQRFLVHIRAEKKRAALYAGATVDIARKSGLKPMRCVAGSQRSSEQKTKRVALLVGGGVLVALLFVLLSVAANLDPAVKSQTMQAVSITVSEKAMKEAEQGDPEAQFTVATLLLADQELNAASSVKAVEFLQRAAEHGHNRAMLRLGQVYRSGIGTLQNYTLAAKWIGSAAKEGEPKAMLALGRLYREGLGVPRNRVNAYIWFNRAAALRDPHAIRERDEVAHILTAEELKKAQHESGGPLTAPTIELKTATENPGDLHDKS